MQKIIIGVNQSGQRLDKFLHKYLPEAGTGFLYKMLRKKNITLNGRKAEGRELLAEGDEVTFFFAEETLSKFRGNRAIQPDREGAAPEKPGGCAEYHRAFALLPHVEVLYEDQNVLLLNKPVGMLAQKAKQDDLSLNEWMIGYLLTNGSITEQELQTFHPSVCNRLDRNTSGIVLGGKSLKGSQALSNMMGKRVLRKLYHTVCVGVLREDMVLEGYLQKDSAANRVHVSRLSQGQDAPGDYIRTAYHPLSSQKGHTLLEVELFTGKTHQIRAHLAGIGHPVIGDYKYGSKSVNDGLKAAYGLEHQLLHAREIIFPEDCGLESMRGRRVLAPYPVKFKQIVQGLGLGGKAGGGKAGF